ncbi:MAG: hypothetical protein JWP93_276 [Polaromonas sp.]|nr:hypothetical protein [Polaromonas sp.]
MTSPVDTSVKFFHNGMLGAPVLRGQVGSLIAILDACLVNGWGVQVATSCVVAAGICTMTFPLDHAAPVDAVILVDGASIAALNGEQKVTATEPNVVKFATAAANGSATGTITAKMAPAGWAKPFASGTTVGVYKSLSVAANGQFLRVNDANAVEARVVGYENMTAISTGTGLFPTTAQQSGGLYWRKSAMANTIAVDWTIVADGRAFYFLPAAYMGHSDDSFYQAKKVPKLYTFGDPANQGRMPDPWSTLIFGDPTTASDEGPYYSLTAGSNTRRYCPRIISGAGTAVQIDAHNTASVLARDSMFDRVSGRIALSPIVTKPVTAFEQGGNSWRALLAGLLYCEHTFMETVVPYRSVFKAGSPERSYLAVHSSYTISVYDTLNLMAFDVTGPWR